MSKLTQGSLIALLAGFGSLPAAAEEEYKQTMDAAADGHVRVYNTSGTIEIVGWSKKSVDVNAYLGDDVRELIYERDDD